MGSLTSGLRGALADHLLTDLYTYCEQTSGLTLYEQPHREMADFLESLLPPPPDQMKGAVQQKGMLHAPRETLKALALDTLVPTPSGMRRIEEIAVGDTVYAMDGSQTKVVAVSPVYEHRVCYKVTFSTGEEVIADADHRWLTESRTDRDNHKRHHPFALEKVRTTQELFETQRLRGEANHRVRLAKAIENEPADLPIPPYTLGVWLGDGTSSTASISTVDKAIIDNILAEDVPVSSCWYDPIKYDLRAKGHPDFKKQSSSIQGRLRALTLLDNKHIPEAYFNASYEQRLALLRGLMDTDGTVSRSIPHFTNTNLRLIEQVRRLVASLGYRPRKIESHEAKLNGKSYGLAYSVAFPVFLDVMPSPFALERKTAKVHATKPRSSKSNGRHIVAVESVPSVPTKCLAVEHPSHTYLITDAYIPTHNTSLVQALVEYYLLKWKRKYNYDGRVLLIRSNREAAKQVLGAIREDLGTNNPVIQEAFGSLGPTGSVVWTTESITLNWRSTNYREASVETGGTESPQTGMHVDLCIMDDLANETNYMSERDMQRARLKIQSIEPIVNRWGSIILVGTRWGHNDPAGFVLAVNEEQAKRHKPPVWRTLIRGAYNEDGTLYYPDHLSNAVLESKRASLEPKLFTAWYLNQVISDDSKVFRPDYLRYYDAASRYTPDHEEIASLQVQGGALDGRRLVVRATMHIDPATTTGDGSNSTGIAVVLTDNQEPEPHYWLHETWKGKEAPSVLIARIVALADLYRPAAISIDVLGQQILWLEMLRAALKKAGLNIPLLPYKGRTHDEKVGRGILGKAKRIEALEPLFRAGRIHLRAGYNGSLLHEYNYYDGPTHRNHFDLLDAVAHLRTMTSPPRPEAFREDLERLEMAELDDMEDASSPTARRKRPGTWAGR